MAHLILTSYCKPFPSGCSGVVFHSLCNPKTYAKIKFVQLFFCIFKSDVDAHFLKVVLRTQFTTGTLPVKIDRWLKLTPSQPRRISLSGRFQSRNKWHRYNDCRMSIEAVLCPEITVKTSALSVLCAQSYRQHFSKTFRVNTPPRWPCG